MGIIKIIDYLSIISFAYGFAILSGIPQFVAKKLGQTRIKPFDCEYCMGFWTSIIYHVWQYQNEFIVTNGIEISFKIIGISFVLALATSIVSSLYKKIA